MGASELTFRNATEADVPALVALVTSSYRGETSRQGWTTEADILDGNRIDPQLLAADIARADSIVLVADAADGGMLACAHVCVESDAGYFGMFAVRPERQGGGIGRRVLAEAECIARERFGVPVLRMSVIDVREDLIGWYERRGYRRTGITKPFPYGDERFGVPKRPDLRFEVLEKALVEAEPGHG
jgi:ribosomal protein S18 acetylase RimI-like enzyme